MSKVEQNMCKLIALVLDQLADGEVFYGDSESLTKVLATMHFYLPSILQEVYDEWRWEAIDGFHPPIVRKIGPCGLELIGLASLLPDCTVTPVHLRLQISVAKHEITWLECRLGEPGDGKGGLNRVPYGSTEANRWLKKFIATETAPEIDWVYQVEFGERE